MPSPSRPTRRKSALPANPVVPSLPVQQQPQLHHRGSHELTPTYKFGTATVLEIHIPLAAVRHVREVVAGILRRLEHDGELPSLPPPAPPALNN